MNTKNKIPYKKVLIFIFSAVLISLAISAFAQTSNCDPTTNTIKGTEQPCYTPLEPGALPGVTESSTNLGAFLGTVFNFGIAAAVVLALIMIIWGGIEMMTSDSWMKHDSGKKKITDALMGLGLALVSWLLLYTINPNLVTFNGNLLLGTGAKTTAPQTTSAPANPAPTF